MQRLFHSVRDAVTAAWDRGRQVRYHTWVEHLRKLILEDAVPLFCQLKDDELDPDSMNMLCKMLEELEPSLDPSYTDGLADKDEDTLIAKQALLELWYHLLDSIERFSKTTKLNPVVYAVILGVVKRPEFDLTRVKVDEHGTFICPEHELLLAQRYRHLLCQTTRFIAETLTETISTLPTEKAFQEMRRATLAKSDAATTSGPLAALEAVANQMSKDQGSDDKNDDNSSQEDLSMFNVFGLAKSQLESPFLTFASKFLAVAFWRLGPLRDDIVASLREVSPNLGAICELPKGTGAEEECDPQMFPLLLSWSEFHTRVRSTLREPDNAARMYPTKDWLKHFSVYGEFFISFFFEWLQNIRGTLGTQHFAWSRLPGYCALAGRFLQLRGAMPPRALTSRQTFQAELNLLTTDNPLIVNKLIFNRFRATPASNLSAILETVSALDVWFAELMKNHFFLGDPFDVEFFCRGIDMIIQFDHHVALAKLLQMLYSYSDLFVGRNRLAIFSDLMLDKHFFNLFLHWDDNVRMMYIQLLVFKMLKTKRRILKDESLSESEEDANNKYSLRAVDMLILTKIDAYVNIVSRTLEELKINNPSVLFSARAATRSSANTGGILSSWAQRRGFDTSLPPLPMSLPAVDDPTPQKMRAKKYVMEDSLLDDGIPKDDGKAIVDTKEESAPESSKPSPSTETDVTAKVTAADTEIDTKETTETTPASPESIETAEGTPESTETAEVTPESAETATASTETVEAVESDATSTTSNPTPQASTPEEVEAKIDSVSITPMIPENKIIYLERALALYKRHMSRYQEWQARINAPIPPLITLT